MCYAQPELRVFDNLWIANANLNPILGQVPRKGFSAPYQCEIG